MGEENQQKIKVEKAKPHKFSLNILKGPGEEREPEPALEEKKIMVGTVTPQIKTVLSEPPREPPLSTVVEGDGLTESKGIPEPDPDAEIYQKVRDELSRNLLENPVSITVKSTELLKVDLAVLRTLIEKNKMKGIVICGDRPATGYIKLLRSRGLDPDAVYYIDVITLFSGHNPTGDEKKPNVAFINNPSDLTSLDIALTQAIERLNKETVGEEKVFLLLDCLASLQLYNTHTRLGMFVHNLTTKLKIHDVYGVIFLLEENKGSVLSSTIQTFCDRNIAL